MQCFLTNDKHESYFRSLTNLRCWSSTQTDWISRGEAQGCILLSQTSVYPPKLSLFAYKVAWHPLFVCQPLWKKKLVRDKFLRRRSKGVLGQWEPMTGKHKQCIHKKGKLFYRAFRINEHLMPGVERGYKKKKKKKTTLDTQSNKWNTDFFPCKLKKSLVTEV